MKENSGHVDELGPTPPAAHKVFGSRVGLAEAYARSLASDGIERGLIGPREVPRIWERHVLNSAALEEAIPRDVRVVDVGSGAGLPGIPLAIARPDLNVQLLEPLLRRTVYLDEIVRELGLNCSVHRGRAEDPNVVKELGGADVVTSRAVAPLGKLTTWSLPLVRVGGSMIALKGSSIAEEIVRDAKQIKKAGGGQPSSMLVGATLLNEPTHVVSVERLN
ncbi:glucose-inhibited division protein B [Corynebacterium resistens DSM 45100]|uniref:Ribosomal RNA small subunit methyltransferase G n=1 Tax=Corynebacterium resistens (strain DSM 45100 / JCM 12819 / GTC 2026 / SICGH 158) TaxID=662755 RepID=F8E3K6_CORRG|nr:16S rRNA (guanine(527)-N(7))-methyltransferase RsmG [Corynebacterium resistens]AEI10532.1 glucose-inhibited division protein B [Corynebacterium resistens DSM 45100]